MAILLAQLGDIHFQDERDIALSRADKIAHAIAALVDEPVSQIILALCGDMANKGQPEHFLLANQFAKQVRSTIEGRTNKPVHIVAVPGNHDCDFKGDQSARNILLESITSAEEPPSSVVEAMLTPLGPYFDFAKDLGVGAHTISKEAPFYSFRDYRDGSGVLRLHLLNTAWMSSKHEVPGSHHFPLSLITPPDVQADSSIAILHHPLNWHSQPETLRPLRDRLQDVASIVLVSHEHVAEAFAHVNLFADQSTRQETIYIAGGVIQDSADSSLCTFNALYIDLTDKLLKINRFALRLDNGDCYFAQGESQAIALDKAAMRSKSGGFALSDNWVKYLDDPEAPIAHPRRDHRLPLTLGDYFLYPDLWELDEDHTGSTQKQLKSRAVVDELLGCKRVLITGEHRSGRTALAKRLFVDFFCKDKLPLLISGKALPLKPEHLSQLIKEQLATQYVNLSLDQYRQLAAGRRTLIIDDLHLMKGTFAQRNSVLKSLESHFDQFIFCGDDLFQLDEAKGNGPKDSALWDYRHFEILGFGEVLREDFVRQWLLLATDSSLAEMDLSLEVARFCEVLNAVIRKQLLPCFPLYLIVVLQQADIHNASVQNGSFGYLFDKLVTSILARGRFTRITIGDKYHYLAGLAKHMYDRGLMALDRDDVELWHRAYWDRIELPIDFDKLFDDLVETGILLNVRGTIRFKYSYYFCYFVAYYLNENIHERACRKLIADLCRALHHRVSADIVLFLAHLTGDPIVLNEMVVTCDSLFTEATPIKLEKDITWLNRPEGFLSQEQSDAHSGEIELPGSPHDNRRKEKAKGDEQVSERLAVAQATEVVVPPEADNETVKRLFEIHASYKTIQILGQALRNIAGSASKERKEEVLKKLILLARRLLGSAVGAAASDHARLESIAEEVAKIHRENSSTLTEIEDISRQIYSMAFFMCFLIIKHTSGSIGSENLIPTIRRVLSEGLAAGR
jgi:hypothetical protein